MRSSHPTSLIKCVRLPLSLLCPYTTLFRSIGDAVGDALCEALLAGHEQIVPDQLDPVAEPVGGQLPSGHVVFGQDRKSTRLNSSHLVISYAVFCLKKKSNQSRPACL